VVPTIAEGLAEHLDGLTFESLTPEVVEKAKLCVLDQLGIQIRGATMPRVQGAWRFIEQLGGRPESRVTWHGLRTTVSSAAYINATFGHSCEFDDTHPTAGHPGAAVIPVALALAESRRATGKEVIAAIVGGYEIMGLSMSPVYSVMIDQGWHGAKITGVFGSAAAAAKLLGLDRLQTTNALAIAGCDASGTCEYDQSGGEVKRLYAGISGRAGLEAALMSQLGMTGSPTIFEGRKGLYRCFGDGSLPQTGPVIGGTPQILLTSFKLYPCVAVMHSTLDCVRRLQAELGFDHGDVDEITVSVAEFVVHHGGTIYRPTDPISAQFSFPYGIGLRLVTGSNDLDQYNDPDTWVDREILAVADKVRVQSSGRPRETTFPSKVEIRLSDGRTAEVQEPIYRGHPSRPATHDELTEKFVGLTSGQLPDGQSRRIQELVATLEELGDLAPLFDALVRPV
jgi:2-methylcitrate dehydratase PrpD